jgi:hypothetical protein
MSIISDLRPDAKGYRKGSLTDDAITLRMRYN